MASSAPFFLVMIQRLNFAISFLPNVIFARAQGCERFNTGGQYNYLPLPSTLCAVASSARATSSVMQAATAIIGQGERTSRHFYSPMLSTSTRCASRMSTQPSALVAKVVSPSVAWLAGSSAGCLLGWYPHAHLPQRLDSAEPYAI